MTLLRFLVSRGGTSPHSQHLSGLERLDGLAGRLKTREWKTRDWKTRDQIAWVEIAGPENAGPKFQGWKRQDWKTREHHVYG